MYQKLAIFLAILAVAGACRSEISADSGATPQPACESDAALCEGEQPIGGDPEQSGGEGPLPENVSMVLQAPMSVTLGSALSVAWQGQWSDHVFDLEIGRSFAAGACQNFVHEQRDIASAQAGAGVASVTLSEAGTFYLCLSAKKAGAVVAKASNNGLSVTVNAAPQTPAPPPPATNDIRSLHLLTDQGPAFVGLGQRFKAFGIYDDDVYEDVSGTATWTSSNPSVATVDSQGYVTGVGAGTTTITVKVKDKEVVKTVAITDPGTPTISIAPLDVGVGVGGEVQLKATISYSNGVAVEGTELVTWNSSDTSIAQVSNTGGHKGRLTAVAAGSTTVTASWKGATSAPVSVTVTAATLTLPLVMKPDAATLYEGQSHQFQVEGLYSDGRLVDLSPSVSWLSSQESVASVSSSGLLTAKGAGAAELRARYQNTHDGTVAVTVKPT